MFGKEPIYVYLWFMDEEKTFIPIVPGSYIRGIAELHNYDAEVKPEMASPNVVSAMQHMKDALTDLQTIIASQNTVIQYLMDNQQFSKRKLG